MNGLTWNIMLALIWVGMTGNFTGSGMAVGFLLGYLLLGVTLRDVPRFSGYIRKVPRVVRFVFFFLRELVVSNLRVAYDVLTPTDYMRPGVIAVPLDASTDGEITLLANLISLTPGSLSLDVSTDRRVLYVHMMYLDDPEQARAQIKYFESRLLELLR
ncbi:Na+/H+ antiporter subunit E [Alcanivorax sp. JB21]|uniref:Na+/H+ antiporter subunit E n=1 Tax=Alcanivorax limicola TaxID=2874102 RepID=UPI001CBF0FE4|nr:Na+/H+ antiporter subunit E [Alcanivorax limicola]MBZ2188465.1 Na+/H+ antiporter subunit E [Alcanivorax limicola]